jgi:hypothetical protein
LLPFLPAGSQNQAGTLTEQKPKGCLASKKVQDALQGLIEPACFNSVKMNVTNSTGADCEIPGTYFNVSFADATKCLDGMDVGGGSMTPVAGESRKQDCTGFEPLATWPVTSPKNLHPVAVCF